MKNHYSKTPLEEYFAYVFGPGKLPPVFLDMRDPRGLLIITDHKYLDDLYVYKNKFFDKAGKEFRVYYSWFGESFSFAPADEKW
jgi:cytochrome P450